MNESQKPSTAEDEYFAREDVEKKRVLARRQAEATAQKSREDLKALHFMKCPKCGMDLQTLAKDGVEVDTCFHCNGLWLDAGELEKIVSRQGKGNVVSAFLHIFKGK